MVGRSDRSCSWNSRTLATSFEELTLWKRPWCYEGLGAGGEGDDRGWDGWMASPTRWAWVWVKSRSWWWTGRPGVLQFMGSQRVGHNWATELNRTELRSLRLKNKTTQMIVWISQILNVDISIIFAKILLCGLIWKNNLNTFDMGGWMIVVIWNLFLRSYIERSRNLRSSVVFQYRMKVTNVESY